MRLTNRIYGLIRRFTGRGDTEYLLLSAANAAALGELIERVRRGDVTRFFAEEIEHRLDRVPRRR
jgi:hypothetical protein